MKETITGWLWGRRVQCICGMQYQQPESETGVIGTTTGWATYKLIQQAMLRFSSGSAVCMHMRAEPASQLSCNWMSYVAPSINLAAAHDNLSLHGGGRPTPPDQPKLHAAFSGC